MTAFDRLQNALHAAIDGRHEEALRDYLWFHDHALAEDPALSGVRRSFALAYWVELGDAYPPARQALVEIRDRYTADLANELRSHDRFRDVAAINFYLKDGARTATLFAQLDRDEPAFANRCIAEALPALIEASAFALARDYLPDPLAELRDACERFNGNVNELAEGEEPGMTPERALLRHEAYVFNYVKRVKVLLALALGCGEPDLATTLERAAVSGVEAPTSRDAVRASLAQASVHRHWS